MDTLPESFKMKVTRRVSKDLYNIVLIIICLKMQNGNIYTEFNEKSEKYRELSEIVAENNHLLEWGSHEVVLDAGCGPGDVTVNVVLPRLPADFKVLVGVDISPKMKQYGLAHHATDRITFDTLDIGQDISEFLRDDRFSQGFTKIFSFYVMNWVTDLEKGVSNLYSLLQPGGQALLTFPINRNFQKTFKAVSIKEPWAEHFKDVPRKISPYLIGENPRKEFEDMLKAAGFEITKCETKDKPDEFDSIQVLKDLVESLDQFVSRIPANQKQQYLNDCVQVMREMKLMEEKDGKVLLSASKIITVIRKPILSEQ